MPQHTILAHGFPKLAVHTTGIDSVSMQVVRLQHTSYNTQLWVMVFASVVLCHNLSLPGLPDHALNVLNYCRTDHNTKPDRWCIAAVV